MRKKNDTWFTVLLKYIIRNTYIYIYTIDIRFFLFYYHFLERLQPYYHAYMDIIEIDIILNIAVILIGKSSKDIMRKTYTNFRLYINPIFTFSARNII